MSALKIEKFDQKGLSNPAIKVIRINKQGQLEYFIKDKCNPKNVVGISVSDNKSYNIPYTMIVEVFDQMPKGIKYKVEKDASPSEIYKNPSFKYVETNERGKQCYYLIEKCNPKNLLGICIKTGKSFNIPYNIITQGLKALPKGIRATKSFKTALEKEDKYSKESLESYTYIEIMLKNKLTKLKIVKLNQKKAKAELLDKDVIYDVPYGLILNATN